ELNNFSNAEKYFNLGGNYTYNAFYAMKADANLGVLYNMWQKPAAALPRIDAALTYFSGSNKTRTSYFGLQATKADILHKLHQYPAAVQALDTLYKYNVKNTITGTPLSAFSVSSFAEQVNNTQIGVLTKTGHVYTGLYEQTKQKQHLQTAHHFYLLAAQLFKTYYTREFYTNYLFSLNQEITKGLLKTGLLLGKTADAPTLLNITENNTSQQVWKKFIGKYRENIDVPDSTLSKRNSLVHQIAMLEIAGNDTKKLGVLKAELAAVDAMIERTTKTHYTFANNNFDVASLQTKLNKEQLMVRYITTDSTVFAFAITKQAIQLFRLATTTEVRQALVKLQPTISTQNQAYVPAASSLYRLLLQPLVTTYQANELVIIPDGEILTLPFEMLYNASTKKYLVQEKIVSYSYALPLYFLQQYSTTAPTTATVTFAPSYPGLPAPPVMATRANMYNLANAATEAEAISKLYKGAFFGTSTATVNNFIQSLGKYNIYHLAMHARVDSTAPENSSLMFYNNTPLYFKQLYQLNFPAGMVVLSACNTGMGATELGEGVQSLSRALTYSGVQSAVYSLWEVPDKETSEIMIQFYENLAKGQSKSLALANA
ncbi:MAG: CHAT domain-containing protein, partial [Bacteroidetes bacterium]